MVFCITPQHLNLVYSDPSESFSCCVTGCLKQEVHLGCCSLAFYNALLTRGIKQPKYEEQLPDCTAFLKNILRSQFETSAQNPKNPKNSKLASFDTFHSRIFIAW